MNRRWHIHQLAYSIKSLEVLIKRNMVEVKRELLRAFFYGFLFYPSFSMWVTRLYVSAKENMRYFSLAVSHTKNIVIDLRIVKLIRNLFRGFSLQGERGFHVNICVFVCNCYLELIILEIILFGTQQNQIWNCKDTFIFLLLQFSCWFCFTISYVLMGNNNYQPILDSLGVC